MTWALLGLLFALLGVVTLFGAWLHGTHKEAKALSDMLIAVNKELEKTRSELHDETLSLAAMQEQLDETKSRLATAEAQRNQAYEAARDHIVERIKKSGIADASKLLSDLLAGGFPTVGVSPLPTAGTTKADTDLINPSDL